MARRKYTEVEEKLMSDIAQNLKKLLISKKWYQKDLAAAAGLSTSVVSDYISAKTLASPGVIEKMAEVLGVEKSDIDPTYAKLSEQKNPSLIPLVGNICAGDGIFTNSNIEDYVCYPFPAKKQPDFALEVKGDSMKDVGIESGDIVYFKKSDWADHNGQIVAVVLNNTDEGVLKRLKWTEGSPLMTLKPENGEYEERHVRPNEITVCGVYMGHFKPVNEMM
jgi:repressor LexA